MNVMKSRFFRWQFYIVLILFSPMIIFVLSMQAIAYTLESIAKAFNFLSLSWASTPKWIKDLIYWANGKN